MTGEEKLKYLEKQLLYFRKRAESDLLTGLYNRISFENYVIERMEKSKEGYFLLMDVDKFKEINDVYGHLNGDKVLQGIGRIIRDTFPEPAVTGRMGGDEFSIYIPSARHDSVSLEERIKDMFEDISVMSEAAGMGQKVKCSMGITKVEEEDDFSSVYRRSDRAMYRAKQSEDIFCWWESHSRRYHRSK